MKRFYTLMAIGIVATVLGMAAYGHDYDKAGAVLLFIGWLIISTIVFIDMWKNKFVENRRFLGIGWKIIAIGFVIFFAGALLEAPDDMGFLSSIIVKVGLYIAYVGFFFFFLGVMEDKIR